MRIEEFAYPDRAALAAAVSRRLVEILQEAIRREGTASLVVPGGTTPVPIFEDLAKADLAWENVNVIPCDERWVPVDHADSNEGLVRRHLLKDKANEARVFALYRPVEAPADALADVARALKAIKRPFDVVFLGMGEDGHIASLFPDRAETAAALALGNESDLMVLKEPAKGHPRIGLTLRALTDARHVILAVPGETKRATLAQAMAQGGDDRLPVAALLRQDRAPVDIMFCS